jgi:hypothetical protein
VSNDKRIAATVIDATYVGKAPSSFLYNQCYRLRAIRSTDGVVKVRLSTNDSEIHLYGSQEHFDSCWVNVRKVAETLW